MRESLPRVPFPIKVFVALMVVLAAGTVPTYIFIETSFASRMVQARVDETAQRASMLAETMRPLGHEERLAKLRELEAVMPERLTYFGPTGVPLYDSTRLAGQGHPPEASQALGRETVGVLQIDERGVGAAQRREDGIDTIFVAVRIDEAGEVVRLAFRATDLVSLTSSLGAAFRNGQALGVTFALLFSVIAAFVFMRPLQRLQRSAQAIARGDYTATSAWRETDEIGDVGAALNEMARELRQRLATAQSSETLLVQAAEFLALPLALVEPDRRVLAINGPFRQMLVGEQADPEELVASLVTTPKFEKAYTAAKSGSDEVTLRWTRKRIGVVLQMQLLARPAAEPLVLLTSISRRAAPTLPHPDEVRPRELGELLNAAIARAQAVVPDCEVAIDYIDVATDLAVVDVEGRVELALAVFLEAASRSASAVRLSVTARPVAVELWVDSDLSTAPLRLVRQLLTPCGGRVEGTEDVSLQIARA